MNEQLIAQHRKFIESMRHMIALLKEIGTMRCRMKAHEIETRICFHEAEIVWLEKCAAATERSGNSFG